MSQIALEFCEMIFGGGVEMKGGGGKGGGITGKLKGRSDVRSPEGLGAFIGRKKAGKSAFQAKAARAKSAKRGK